MLNIFIKFNMLNNSLWPQFKKLGIVFYYTKNLMKKYGFQNCEDSTIVCYWIQLLLKNTYKQIYKHDKIVKVNYAFL